MTSVTPIELPEFDQLVDKIERARSILLTTHRQCDGDGVGAEIALFHALNKAGKKVRILNVDHTPKKYRFLQTDALIETFEGPHRPLESADLALIFDTNDHRLVEPLYSTLKAKCRDILFIDHHPLLTDGPQPTGGSFIETKAASTGEIAFNIIKRLKIPLDGKIARALYTSIVFDTQMFRYIRTSSNSHLIAAELLQHETKPEEVHRYLFANNSVEKISFLAKALNQIEYFANGRIAILKLRDQDLVDHKMEWDESRDVIDMIMNIESLEAAALFREDGTDEYKLSLRSKGYIEVLGIAESLGGGGHLFSSGAYLRGSYDQLKRKVLDQLIELLKRKEPSNGSSP